MTTLFGARLVGRRPAPAPDQAELMQQVVELARQGYVLRYADSGWEVGAVEQRGEHNTYYDVVVSCCESPAEAIERALAKIH